MDTFQLTNEAEGVFKDKLMLEDGIGQLAVQELRDLSRDVTNIRSYWS